MTPWPRPHRPQLAACIFARSASRPPTPIRPPACSRLHLTTARHAAPARPATSFSSLRPVCTPVARVPVAHLHRPRWPPAPPSNRGPTRGARPAVTCVVRAWYSSQLSVVVCISLLTIIDRINMILWPNNLLEHATHIGPLVQTSKQSHIYCTSCLP